MYRPNILERNIEQRAVEHAETLEYYTLKLNGGGNRGKLDRLFVSKFGEHVYIEFKRPGEKLRDDQWLHVRDLTARGCTVYECCNADHARRILDCHSHPGAEVIEGRLSYAMATAQLQKSRIEL